MEKGKIFTNCLLSIWTLLFVTSFASCSADSNDIIDNEIEPVAATQNAFSFTIKAYSEGEDVTPKGDVKNTTLFVFDENNDFFSQINVDNSYLLENKPIQIDCPYSDRITVIAWGGLSTDNEEISALDRSNMISDLQIKLKQNNGVINNFKGDLFYGQVSLNRTATKTSANVLKITRKVAALQLVTKGIIKKFDSREGNYFYKVKNTKGSFDHNGNLIGNDVEYLVPASLNEQGNLVAQTTPILPSSDITIELYRDNERILCNKNLKNSEIVAAKEGEKVNIIFDLSKQNCKIAVASWGSVTQIVTVG